MGTWLIAFGTGWMSRWSPRFFGCTGVEVRIRLETAEFAIVGPDERRQRLWTILFDTSSRRGDWLRPITGWQSKAKEERLWTQITGKDWRTP